ncbi:TetR/AcrR family transcriptional regulator [Mycobacterium florentinum]|uniref:TetR/AcrR family transcriptional regulator n=1 Tax=Mycobacterium florentinum TaxID=292462 RepID=UPI00138C6C09|nr:TetR/AcrR family transcriptional regulator [Mycobacterium florentinum]BBX82120.1 TetR family transcriptional regulator [Mycobacterium florentinum]
MATRVPPSAEQSTRRRILAATFVVLARAGRKKLMLSEVAAEAKVSRPTLYRYFPPEALLDAFGLYEQDNFDAGISSAMAGLRGVERLDAALQFVVDFQRTYSLGFLVDTEPEHVLFQMKRVMPILHGRIERLIDGDNADLAAATVVRVAVCHYLVGADDRERFLAELRYAAGISPRRQASRSATA